MGESLDINISRSTPSEAVWTFYAALSLWAILKFGNALGIAFSGSKKTNITCKYLGTTLWTMQPIAYAGGCSKGPTWTK